MAWVGEGVRVVGVAALLPDLIQRHRTKRLTASELPDRPAKPERRGGLGVDQRTATVALGRSERVRERGTSEGEEEDLGLARVWHGRVAYPPGETMGRRRMVGA